MKKMKVAATVALCGAVWAVSGAALAEDAIKKGDQQSKLEQNDIVITRKAEQSRAAQVAPTIAEAGKFMNHAADALYNNKQGESLQPQTEAVATLDRALKELEEAEAALAQQMEMKAADYFIKQYEAIKKEQEELKTNSQAIEQKMQASGSKELDRADELQAQKLAGAQNNLIGRIGELSTDDVLKEVEVVVFLNQQVVEMMETSKKNLEKAKLGAETASAQEGAIEEIEIIIAALKDNEGTGKSGQCKCKCKKPGPDKLVKAHQLFRMLKGMQLIVNRQTKMVNAGLKDAKTAEAKQECEARIQQLTAKQSAIEEQTRKVVYGE